MEDRLPGGVREVLAKRAQSQSAPSASQPSVNPSTRRTRERGAKEWSPERVCSTSWRWSSEKRPAAIAMNRPNVITPRPPTWTSGG